MSDYPYNYELQNNSLVKQLNVVVEFEGIDATLSLLQTYKKIRYGEDGIKYGDPGLVWGGLIPIGNSLPVISPNSNLIISQRIEPEQGRGSAGTFSLELQDKDGLMTKFVSPGQTFNQLLGGKLIKIRVGYQNTSYPEDYFVAFRGYVSGVTAIPTKVILQLTDANLKRRQQCFYLGKSVSYSAVKQFTPAAVNIGTNTITVNGHGYTKDMKITFGSDVSLPGGIEFGAEYYCKPVDVNNFKISLTWDGPEVDITSTGSGSLQVVANKIAGLYGYSYNPSQVDAILDKFNIPNHGFLQDTPLNFTATGVVPGGLTVGVTYYCQVLNSNEFQLSLTPSGLIIDITSQGVGDQQMFISTAPMSSTKIPMAKTDGFAEHILGPSGAYDTSVKTYIKIDDEFMEYGPGDISSDGITVSRGARGSAITEHEIGSDVTNHVEISGNPIDLALKIMLSGWAGPCLTGLPIAGFQLTGLVTPSSLTRAVILKDKVNAVDDYGLSVGDYISVTGSVSNDGTYTVAGFGDLSGYPNKVVYVNEALADEWPTSSIFSIRSQYDVFPTVCGNRLKPYDVDVARFQETKINFLFQSFNNMRILQSDPIASKELIERDLFLPCGCYSVTRFGKLSVTKAKPPIIDGRSIFLDNTMIVDPQNISIQSALNTRTFFNEVQYQYNQNDDGSYEDTLSILDTESLSNFDTSSVLPIQAKGLHSDLNAESFIDRHGKYILNRYKNTAYVLNIKTNWKASSLIEVGDVIPIYDNGTLHISNFQDGSRDLGAQLFEVWERTLDMKTGTAQLKLATQPGYLIDDRFGTISPSTKVSTGSSGDRVKIKDSFGAIYPGNEKKKWDGFEGEQVLFHSYDFSYQETKTFIGFDPSDPYVMIVDPPFITPPAEDTIIDISDFDDTSAAIGQKYKIAFAFIDPTLSVVSGVSTTQFNVSLGDAAKMSADMPVLIRSSDWSQESSEAKVDSIVGTLVTLKTAIEFIPSVGDKVELVGFTDGPSGPYRIL